MTTAKSKDQGVDLLRIPIGSRGFDVNGRQVLTLVLSLSRREAVRRNQFVRILAPHEVANLALRRELLSN
jgi:hypothetical protein